MTADELHAIFRQINGESHADAHFAVAALRSLGGGNEYAFSVEKVFMQFCFGRYFFYMNEARRLAHERRVESIAFLLDHVAELIRIKPSIFFAVYTQRHLRVLATIAEGLGNGDIGTLVSMSALWEDDMSPVG